MYVCVCARVLVPVLCDLVQFWSTYYFLGNCMYGWKWLLALGLISKRLMLVLQGTYMHDCGYVHIHVINPQRMREGYSSHSVCVSVSVCCQASCYIPNNLCIENKFPLSFLWHFQDMYCVDFVENT